MEDKVRLAAGATQREKYKDKIVSTENLDFQDLDCQFFVSILLFFVVSPKTIVCGFVLVPR